MTYEQLKDATSHRQVVVHLIDEDDPRSELMPDGDWVGRSFRMQEPYLRLDLSDVETIESARARRHWTSPMLPWRICGASVDGAGVTYSFQTWMVEHVTLADDEGRG